MLPPDFYRIFEDPLQEAINNRCSLLPAARRDSILEKIQIAEELHSSVFKAISEGREWQRNAPNAHRNIEDPLVVPAGNEDAEFLCYGIQPDLCGSLDEEKAIHLREKLASEEKWDDVRRSKNYATLRCRMIGCGH